MNKKTLIRELTSVKGRSKSYATKLIEEYTAQVQEEAVLAVEIVARNKDKEIEDTKKEMVDEGITSLKRIQANSPIADPVLQNRKKVDIEIERLKSLLK